jgi:[ribosomal protein S5]-alanine N-acetyltransferase
MGPTKIECEGFILRRLEVRDAPAITKYCQDPLIHQMTVRIPFPYELKDGEWFVNDSIQKWDEGKEFNFGIVVNNEVVGICGLAGFDPLHRNAELGYWLGKPFRGQGIMSKAAKAVVRFAFEELKVHRLDVWHMEENEGSKRIIQKLGFTHEGMRREGHLKNGEWKSSVMYGLLEEEYKKIKLF